MSNNEPEPFVRPERKYQAVDVTLAQGARAAAVAALSGSATLRTSLEQRFGTQADAVRTAFIEAAQGGMFDLQTFARNIGKTPNEAQAMYEFILRDGKEELADDAGDVPERVAEAGADVIETGEK